MNRKLIVSLGGASLLALAAVAGVSAAGPNGGTMAGPVGAANGGAHAVAGVLNLTQAQIAELRASGLSIAQIAERQGIDVQTVIDALGAQWTERIQVRVDNGALTDEQAAALEAQVQARVEAMVNDTATGGMQGAAVGAGPAAMAGRRAAAGAGAGPLSDQDGTCDGTGTPAGPRGVGMAGRWGAQQ